MDDAKTESEMRTKYYFTPDMDNLITRTYRGVQPIAGRTPVVRLLAKSLDIPCWKISRRARDIGAYEPRIKEPKWSDAELKILESNARKQPEVIQRHLKKHGFKRSITGIILKRKRMRYLKNLEGYTSRQIAEAFGIDDHCITRWIKKGYLKAERRGTLRTEIQGGDMWYIKEKNIKKFIIENIGIIDIRKVEKFWFVDILINGN